MHFPNLKVRPEQHTCAYDFTMYRCKEEKPEEPCTYSPGYTWQKYSQAQRIFVVRGKDKGRPAWHYVLLVDDDKTIDRLKEQIDQGNIDVNDFGQDLKSGWGKDPPDDVKQWIDETYGQT